MISGLGEIVRRVLLKMTPVLLILKIEGTAVLPKEGTTEASPFGDDIPPKLKIPFILTQV